MFIILFLRFDLGIDNERVEIFLVIFFLINGYMKKNFIMLVKYFYKFIVFESWNNVGDLIFFVYFFSIVILIKKGLNMYFIYDW